VQGFVLVYHRPDHTHSSYTDTIPREGGASKMTNMGDIVGLLKKEHDRLSKQIQGISAALSAFGAAYGKQNGARGRMSAAGRERIAEAQRQRWAKLKAKNGKPNVVVMPTKRTMSAAARKKIAAAQRLRWAKVKKAAK